MTLNLSNTTSGARIAGADDDRCDGWFDPFRAPHSEKTHEVVKEIVRRVEAYERYYRLRKRKRRPADQKTLEETVAAICANLIHQHLIEPGRWIAISLSNQVLGRKSRYRAPAVNKTLPAVLDILAAPEMGFVEMSKGEPSVFFEDEEGVHRLRGKLTTIRAGKALVRRIEDRGLAFGDLGRSESEEVIILKASKNGHRDKGEWIDYEDTPETMRFREEVREVNRWLADADIILEQDPDEPVVDVYQRRLVRVFNNASFRQGGRLFGGFWLNLKKENRRRDLFIDGETVVELDYGQMSLRLLYALEGATPPGDDLYRIPGYEFHREGVKKIINSALFAEGVQTRMPQGTRGLFPRVVGYPQLIKAINGYHQPSLVTSSREKGWN